MGNNLDTGYEARRLAASFLPLRASQGRPGAQGGTFCTSSDEVENALEGSTESRLLSHPQSPLHCPVPLVPAVINDFSDCLFTCRLHPQPRLLAHSWRSPESGQQVANSKD